MFKMNFSRCHIAVFLFTVILMTFLYSCFPVSAVQTGKDIGWLEIRASVPDDFNRSVVISVENTETLDVYDIELLSINDYVASQQIPAGHYTVSMAFVYQNYTYNVVVAEPEFTVEPDSAAALLNVDVTHGEKIDATTTPSSEPEPSADPIHTEPPVENIEPTPSTDEAEESTTSAPEDESNDDDSFSAKNLVISAIGSIFFAGFIFGILYIIRRHFDN